MYQSPFESSDSSSVLRAGWRYRRAVVLAVLAGLTIGILYGLTRDTSVTAATNVVLNDAAAVDRSIPTREQNGAYERFVRSQALFAVSDDVLELVAERAEASLEDVRADVSVTAVGAGESLRFQAAADDEAAARDLLDTHLLTYEEVRKARIADDTATAQEVLAGAGDGLNEEAEGALEVSAVELQIATEIYDDGVAFSDRVHVDSASRLMAVAIPAIAATMLFAAAALVVASMLDDRNPLVLGSHTLIARHHAPVRGVIPARDEDRPTAYDRLAAEVETAIARRDPADSPGGPVIMTVAVGSVDPDDDVAGSMTRSMADSGMRICLLAGRSRAADAPAPEFPEPFRASVTEEATPYESAAAGRVVMVSVAGTSRTMSDFARDASFADYMRSLQGRFDAVVIACAPLDDDPGALKMAPHSDEALMIVPGGTALHEVDRSVYALRQTGVRVSGYVSTGEPLRTRADHWWAG